MCDDHDTVLNLNGIQVWKIGYKNPDVNYLISLEIKTVRDIMIIDNTRIDMPSARHCTSARDDVTDPWKRSGAAAHDQKTLR